MTIHDEHPFADPEGERDVVRRLRGRLGGPVTVWTSGAGAARAGLTVSSLVVVQGRPAHLLGLVDPDSDLAARVLETRTAVVSLLRWPHRDLAEAFAGQAPAPGGLFRLGSWEPTPWGPRLADAAGWVGTRVVDDPTEVGWSMLLDLTVEQVVLAEDDEPLVHRRGRYARPPSTR